MDVDTSPSVSPHSSYRGLEADYAEGNYDNSTLLYAEQLMSVDQLECGVPGYMSCHQPIDSHKDSMSHQELMSLEETIIRAGIRQNFLNLQNSLNYPDSADHVAALNLPHSIIRRESTNGEGSEELLRAHWSISHQQSTQEPIEHRETSHQRSIGSFRETINHQDSSGHKFKEFTSPSHAFDDQGRHKSIGCLESIRQPMGEQQAVGCNRPIVNGVADTTSSACTTQKHRCNLCSLVFLSKSELLAHRRLAHRGSSRSGARALCPSRAPAGGSEGPVKSFSCPDCGKMFASASYLSQHARIHLGVKPYACQQCDRRFTQLCHLQQHIRTHTGEKPYRCDHAGCTKSFSQLSNLQSHTRSHMADRPHRCHSCYRCFADEPALLAHIPHHTGSKLLKTHICAACGKAYAHERYLARHATKQHGEGGVGGEGDVRGEFGAAIELKKLGAEIELKEFGTAIELKKFGTEIEMKKFGAAIELKFGAVVARNGEYASGGLDAKGMKVMGAGGRMEGAENSRAALQPKLDVVIERNGERLAGSANSEVAGYLLAGSEVRGFGDMEARELADLGNRRLLLDEAGRLSVAERSSVCFLSASSVESLFTMSQASDGFTAPVLSKVMGLSTGISSRLSDFSRHMHSPRAVTSLAVAMPGTVMSASVVNSNSGLFGPMVIPNVNISEPFLRSNAVLPMHVSKSVFSVSMVMPPNVLSKSSVISHTVEDMLCGTRASETIRQPAIMHQSVVATSPGSIAQFPSVSHVDSMSIAGLMPAMPVSNEDLFRDSVDEQLEEVSGCGAAAIPLLVEYVHSLLLKHGYPPEQHVEPFRSETDESIRNYVDDENKSYTDGVTKRYTDDVIKSCNDGIIKGPLEDVTRSCIEPELLLMNYAIEPAKSCIDPSKGCIDQCKAYTADDLSRGHAVEAIKSYVYEPYKGSTNDYGSGYMEANSKGYCRDEFDSYGENSF